VNVLEGFGSNLHLKLYCKYDIVQSLKNVNRIVK